MVKPSACQSDPCPVTGGVWPLLTPACVLTILRWLVTGLSGVWCGWGGVGRRMGKRRGEASAIFLIS